MVVEDEPSDVGCVCRLEAPPCVGFVDVEAAVDVKEESALGRVTSGVMVVRRVSQASFSWSSSGLKLRCRSPRPSITERRRAA
jgi:hypothetical protein